MSQYTRSMRLWILRAREELPESDNPWEPWYDKAVAFVVRAATEKEARRLANDSGGDETGPVRNDEYRMGGDLWLDPKYSTCAELAGAGEPEMIVGEYHSTG